MKSRMGPDRKVACVLGAALAAVLAAATPLRSAFVRGDADKNGSTEITDAVVLLNFMFLGGPPAPCEPVADVNNDGGLDLSDPVGLLNYLFLGGTLPPDLTNEEEAECAGLDPAAIARGMEVFEKPDPLGNHFACGTCHEMVPDAESSYILPGHSLVNALRRPTYKAGQLTKFIDAANVCRVDWMTTTVWQDESPQFKDLVAFMESLSPPGPAPALNYEINCSPQPGPAGDGTAGCKLFNRSCFVCHSTGGVGSDLAPSLVDLNVEDLNKPDYIRGRIRRSGPSVVDNPDVVYSCLLGQMVMPFWAKDKLSDQDVENLIAFVGLARKAASEGKPTFECPDDPPDPNGNVLRRGTLIGRQHGVMGTVEELDTKKLRFTMFHYDGGGIVVKTWLFNQGNVRGGVAIGNELRRPTPYVDETVVVEILPEHYDATGKLKYDSVSVWCTAARVSFGDALLGPPQ